MHSEGTEGSLADQQCERCRAQGAVLGPELSSEVFANTELPAVLGCFLRMQNQPCCYTTTANNGINAATKNIITVSSLP